MLFRSNTSSQWPRVNLSHPQIIDIHNLHSEVEGIQIIGENHCYLTVAYHGWSGEKPKTTLNMIYEIEWD